MTRVALGLGVLFLFGCGPSGGPVLLPPYEGPLKAGQENPTGYQPGSVNIFDMIGGPSGGAVYGVHSYEVVLAPGINWSSADALAKATFRNGVAGHLATITSPEENAVVEALRIAVTTREVWLGGFQPAGSTEPGGGWTWVNGEGAFPGANGGPVYANWAPGEPNDWGGPPQNYVSMGRYNDGTWNDSGDYWAPQPGIGGFDGYVIEWDY